MTTTPENLSQTASQWEAEICAHIESWLEIERSEAMALIEAQEFALQQAWGRNLSSEDAASYLVEASTPSPVDQASNQSRTR
jgi:hypothetical protein